MTPQTSHVTNWCPTHHIFTQTAPTNAPSCKIRALMRASSRRPNATIASKVTGRTAGDWHDTSRISRSHQPDRNGRWPRHALRPDNGQAVRRLDGAVFRFRHSDQRDRLSAGSVRLRSAARSRHPHPRALGDRGQRLLFVPARRRLALDLCRHRAGRALSRLLRRRHPVVHENSVAARLGADPIRTAVSGGAARRPRTLCGVGIHALRKFHPRFASAA